MGPTDKMVRCLRRRQPNPPPAATSSASTWARRTRRSRTSIRRKSRGRSARSPCRNWSPPGSMRPERRCLRSTINRARRDAAGGAAATVGRGNKGDGPVFVVARIGAVHRKRAKIGTVPSARCRRLRPRAWRGRAGPVGQFGQVMALPLGRRPHGRASCRGTARPTWSGSRRSRSVRGIWPTSARRGTTAFPRDPLAEQDFVLTLPASFDEVARELTVKAAALAGLPRVVLIEEPQAAFYAWIDAQSRPLGPTRQTGPEDPHLRHRRRHVGLHADPRPPRRRRQGAVPPRGRRRPLDPRRR